MQNQCDKCYWKEIAELYRASREADTPEKRSDLLGLAMAMERRIEQSSNGRTHRGKVRKLWERLLRIGDKCFW